MILDVTVVWTEQQDGLVARCLLQGELAHQETERCWAVLEEGPCGAGRWLEPDWEEGAGVCRQQLQCESGEAALVGQSGPWCGRQLYTRADCPADQLLLPTGFQLGRPPCPGSFTCRPWAECPAWREAVQAVKDPLLPGLREHLQSLVCDKEARAVCCPPDSLQSFISVAGLVASLVDPGAECGPHPCNGEMELKLKEETGAAGCQLTLFAITSVPSKKCRRRFVWSNPRNRCVRAHNKGKKLD